MLQSELLCWEVGQSHLIKLFLCWLVRSDHVTNYSSADWSDRIMWQNYSSADWSDRISRQDCSFLCWFTSSFKWQIWSFCWLAGWGHVTDCSLLTGRIRSCGKLSHLLIGRIGSCDIILRLLIGWIRPNKKNYSYADSPYQACDILLTWRLGSRRMTKYFSTYWLERIKWYRRYHAI
jgi:hypothetical protein